MFQDHQGPTFDLRQTLVSTPSSEHARNWSAYYTSETHLAGQGWKQAQWTHAKWREFGVTNTTISSHDTQLPLPTNEQRVALLRGDQVLYEAALVDTNVSAGFVPAYFGFSANGNISGSYIYCNFGSKEDFEALAHRGVKVERAIGIIKLGNASPYVREQNLSIFRSLSVANAERAGMIGVVLYTDPQNDGPMTEGNGYKPFPAGIARPLEAIERGGFGNIADYNRGELPTIPSIPISTVDAIYLLRMLNGHGPQAKQLGDRWQGGGLEYYGVDYNVGPSPPGLSLNIVNHATLRDTQVHNVIGTISGKTLDEVVIVGNHRDAWGPGAADPASGSAALNEVVRSFGAALQQGWRPERTIIFGSFEGEEFAQIGSLLWITQHFDWLRASAVAYLNVVVAASGTHFHAKGSPLLYSAIRSTTDGIPWPDRNQTFAGQSVLDIWGGEITPAGSGDANRFMSIPCVSTLDFGFSPALGEPPLPYHTGFDSFEWMDTIGDPEWRFHVASAKIWSLVAAHLVEPAVLNMSVADYAVAFHKWLGELPDRSLWSSRVNLTVMTDAVERLSRAAGRFDGFARSSAEEYSECTRSWWKFISPIKCRRRFAVRDINKVYMEFERQFYYERGLDGHNDHHHVLFSPSAWHNSPPAMPSLSKSLKAGDWKNAQVRNFSQPLLHCVNAANWSSDGEIS
ncbi:uncharacterized protein BJX67DRAFT_387809 [Aspergillus lucknowensis]|uniref:Glutamate carboxypeptidase n=1 Tax=Aspergillus lucknowensis TaxID=176173 RepID=A0ABR4LSQ1_9EURO